VILFLLGCARSAGDAAGKRPPVRNVADSSFAREVLQSQKPVVVDFWARGCLPCWQLAPHFGRLASEYAGRVDFCKVKLGWNAESRRRYGIDAVPTLVFYARGRECARLVGLPEDSTATQLRSFVETGLLASR
jgi:thioredoxin 1